MTAGGVWEIDGAASSVLGFVATGAGAHGLYPSRDARYLYVTNRGEGTISVLSFATRQGRRERGGSPAAGAPTWAASRPTARCSGSRALQQRGLRDRHAHRAPLARIPVGAGPHGLCVWPQPGRYSLGHTGNMR